MSKILVTGANGQLGSEIRHISADFPFEFIFTGSSELDITDKEAVRDYFEKNSIDVVINCAAYTAVDRAETDAGAADKVNHLAVPYLASAAKELQIKFIHISTDYVFDGQAFQPYSEDAIPNPQGVYGRTKLAGEQALVEMKVPNSLVIRTLGFTASTETTS